MKEVLIGLAYLVVPLVLAIVFGLHARNESRKRGEAEARLGEAKKDIKEYENKEDAPVGPDPTIDELLWVSRKEADKRGSDQ